MSNDEQMPGAWICDKCGFILQKNILHTGDGQISADDSPLNNPCPNDGILMRPLTWRETNDNLFRSATKFREALDEAWDHLRSVYEVAHRSGEDTNWTAFENRTIDTIQKIVIALDLTPKMPNMAVTAKTFRRVAVGY